MKGNMLQEIEKNRSARKKQIRYVDYGEFGVDQYDKTIDHLVELLKMGDIGVKLYIIETNIFEILKDISEDTEDKIKERLINIGRKFIGKNSGPDETYVSFYEEEIDMRIAEAKDALQLCYKDIDEYRNSVDFSNMHGRHTEILYRRRDILESRIQELEEKKERLKQEIKNDNNTAKRR